MGERYLVELAQVLRDAGLAVEEVDGWEHRARGSGGYGSGLPSHLMIHHTASGPGSDGWPDVEYCCFGDEDAPLCNLYVDRQGVVYVCAAGATNCNGSGHDPCGWTNDDSMNSAAISIEAGNDGQGERWPDEQLDAYTTLCAALCAAYAIPTARVHAHAEWAPDRKVDPAGPARYAAGAGTWDMDSFRSDCAGGDDTQPIPLPGGDDVEKYLVRDTDGYPWVTDFASYATSITEEQAEDGVKYRGYVKGADNHPFPLSESDSDLMRRLAGQP